MAKNGSFKMLIGPLDAKRKAGGSLGGEDVNVQGPKSVPDPLGYNKTKGAKKSADSGYGSEK